MPKEAQKKILIVDDEKPMARAFGLKLNHVGFVSRTAGDGEEALVALKKEKFDLIILDLVMPKMDGFELLARLKEEGSTVPIIVTTNLSQAEDAKRAKELGARDYFVKSDTPIASIVDHVKTLLHS